MICLAMGVLLASAARDELAPIERELMRLNLRSLRHPLTPIIHGLTGGAAPPCHPLNSPMRNSQANTAALLPDRTLHRYAAHLLILLLQHVRSQCCSADSRKPHAAPSLTQSAVSLACAPKQEKRPAGSNKRRVVNQGAIRPVANQLVAPSRQSITISRTSGPPSLPSRAAAWSSCVSS